MVLVYWLLSLLSSATLGLGTSVSNSPVQKEPSAIESLLTELWKNTDPPTEKGEPGEEGETLYPIEITPGLSTPEEALEPEQTADNPFGLALEYHYNSEDLQKYQSWVKECIDFSRKGRFCLVVDKAAHEMDLYQNGELKKTYLVELGISPYDDKKMEGDNATPEGLYRIAGVKFHSLFNKALLINYPNQNDEKEFKQRKKEGAIPEDAEIGGAIEIHGLGSGKGRAGHDWTAGCVSLSDEDMDDLYEKATPGKNRKKIEVAIVKYGARDAY